MDPKVGSRPTIYVLSGTAVGFTIGWFASSADRQLLCRVGWSILTGWWVVVILVWRMGAHYINSHFARA